MLSQRDETKRIRERFLKKKKKKMVKVWKGKKKAMSAFVKEECALSSGALERARGGVLLYCLGEKSLGKHQRARRHTI